MAQDIWYAKLNRKQNAMILSDSNAPETLKVAAFFSEISDEYTQIVTQDELNYLHGRIGHNFGIEMIF